MINMFIEMVLLYAIKKALGLEDKEVKWSSSPFGLNAKVDAKYSRCKQIAIYKDYKECDIFFEKSVDGGTINEINNFGIINVLPIEMPSEDKLRFTPIIKDGVRIHMSWR